MLKSGLRQMQRFGDKLSICFQKLELLFTTGSGALSGGGC